MFTEITVSTWGSFRNVICVCVVRICHKTGYGTVRTKPVPPGTIHPGRFAQWNKKFLIANVKLQ